MKVEQLTLRTATHAVLDIKTMEKSMPIPFDIYIKKEKNYVLIIEAGTLLTDKIFQLLSLQKSLYARRDDAEKKKLNCETLSFYIKANQKFPEKNIHFLYKANAELFVKMLDKEFSSMNVSCLESIANNIIALVKNNERYLKDTIQYFSNDYALDIHSLHVAIYAVNLGNLLNLNADKLLSLGVAGLIHDIGIQKIDDSITHKSLELDALEFKQMQKHPKYGVEIIEHNHIHNPYIIDGVLHHHERYDGSGYPNKLYASQISEFASILGICDVFDALTNNRPHRKKHTYFEALKLMLKDESMRNKFNDAYLKIFLKSLI
jgi:HD-GYP domain-containing protein (c-di-GMP phosphodiesterase class II)